MSEVLYRARDVTRTYRSGSRDIPVLRGLSLELRAGEVAAVVGASGVGKSTLLHILGLLDRPETGHLEMGDLDVATASTAVRDRVRNEEIGFVFQFFHLVPELDALDNVLLPARIGAGMLEWARRRGELRERAAALLDDVGLGERLTHRPAQLSGGERQRVAIARALINEPRVLLCDEPTGNLDPGTSRDVWKVLRGFRGDDRAILVVTHDDRLAAATDRILRLENGVLREFAPATAGKGESA